MKKKALKTFEFTLRYSGFNIMRIQAKNLKDAERMIENGEYHTEEDSIKEEWVDSDIVDGPKEVK